MNATTQQILDFVHQRFPGAEIAPEQDIFALGYINSLFAMELVMFIEQTFGFTVPNDELKIDTFRTANAMTALIERLGSGVPVG